MNKITQLLIIISIVMTAVAVNAQQECAVVCHQGSIIRTFNASALKGHLKHGDVLISTDCESVDDGQDCSTLSLPKIDFSIRIPADLEYGVYDTVGRLLDRGYTNNNLYNKLPSQTLVFLIIDGYQPLRLIKKAWD